MQLNTVAMNSASKTKLNAMSQTTSLNNVTESDSKFGAIFSKVMSEQNNVMDSTEGNDVDLNQLSELVNSESLEEVLDILGIPHDEGILTIQTSDEQSFKSIDELMNLEDLLALLNIDQSQQQNVLEQVLSTEQLDLNINDVWQLIQLVNEQAPDLITQLTTSLQGEHKVTPKEAEQLLKLLKLAETIGKSSDLIGEQPIQLGNLKAILNEINELINGNQEKVNQSSTIDKVQSQLLNSTQSVSIQNSNTSNISIQSFQQIVEKLNSTSETQATTAIGQQTNVTVPKTVTITLPVEKSAQGEALVKEIQQLIGRGQFSNGQGTMKLLLKLYPENLGSIRIEVMQKDGVLSVRLLASTPQAKELLDSQINQLKTSFAQANIQMDRIDIAQSLQDPDRNLRDQNLFSNFFRQQQESENDQEEQNDEDEEQLSFQDYLINEGV